MNMKNECKKPVMPTLKAMKVGEKVEFPIERYDVVRVTTGRLNLLKKREGAHYSHATRGLVIEVTRRA
jgi:hypothetical protein